MIDKAEQHRLMTRYLFGEVSEEERAEFEDRYLKNSDVFQELIGLENEIIDRYVLGELSPPERERFERSFLTHPERRQTVEIARSLLAHSASVENVSSHVDSHFRGERLGFTSKPAAWRMQVAAAAVFLLMTAGIVALLMVNRRMGNEVARLRTEQARTAHDREALRQQMESLKADLQNRDSAIQRRQVESRKADLQKHDSAVQQLAELQNHRNMVSFTLGGELSRGNHEPTKLIIPANVSSVSLHLNMARDPHSHYNLSLKTAGGNLVWREENIQSRIIDNGSQEIALVLPAHLFHNGDYVIRVTTGREDVFDNVAGFTFRVVKH